jgi:hypothetical protein
MQAMIHEEWVRANHAGALSPDHPVIRGTAQNPDVFFQAREAANRFYQACPSTVQETMDRFAELTGSQYGLFGYHGPADAERVIVITGSGAEAAAETVDFLNQDNEKVGVLRVCLLPALAVLDRTKEPGSAGEPLSLDCSNALQEAGRTNLRIVGGRYALSSKKFTPPMIKSVFDNLKEITSKNHFSIGTTDDVHRNQSRLRSFAPRSPLLPPMAFRVGSDWRGSKCRNLFGENRLRAWRNIELAEIRVLRRAIGSLPALARKDRFHSSTLAGVTSSNLTACTLVNHFSVPPRQESCFSLPSDRSKISATICLNFFA